MIRVSTGGFGLPQTITRGLGGISWLYADTFWGALRQYLKSVSSLASLTEVYFKQAAPGYRLPCLIVTPINDDAETPNAPEYWEKSYVYITVLAADDMTAESLGQAAYKALSPWINDNGAKVLRPKLRAVDSYEMGSVPMFKRRAILSGRGPGNKNVWACHMQFTFLVGRSHA